MDGVHDAGGMHGYGSVPYQKDEPYFHHEWEGRVLSILTWMHLKGISWWDKSRIYREKMGNENYVNELRKSYYTHWLSAAERLLVDSNIFTEQERRHRVGEILDGTYRDRVPTKEFDESEIEAAISTMHEPHSLVLPGPTPSYEPGDRVLVKNMNPSGHTRCPKYVRNRVGEVVMSHGPQIYPESSSVGAGPDPKPLYTVGFKSKDLWGDDGNENDVVYVDLWEPYLSSPNAA
ncbi:nitrile hydratase subunit beta [Pseudonocardia sp. C8]|uniref:nitrile hydratase subunit beta n=1 Tax=Pseudonocardia sp. C8 TaxID=2762759 RepID=UPI001642FE6D|nr:nitrile hydratase subunit beta [Pseudonocardia sp. C8]MBC3194737.1 nitrile hydratase subunit beta [Pseudonocardia sp. C8]